MMTEIEIETIRLALDTEIEHKNYAKHDLAARKILKFNEDALKQEQTLPIPVVSVNKERVAVCDKCGSTDTENWDDTFIICECKNPELYKPNLDDGGYDWCKKCNNIVC